MKIFVNIFVYVQTIKYINKQTLLKDNNVSNCFTVADPASLLASNSVLGSLFSPENSSFIQLLKK